MLVRRGVRVIPLYCLHEPMKRKEKTIKKNKDNMRPSHSKHSSYVFVYVYSAILFIFLLISIKSTHANVRLVKEIFSLKTYEISLEISHRSLISTTSNDE
jgi:presenilin-like A22 family membrane protease